MSSTIETSKTGFCVQKRKKTKLLCSKTGNDEINRRQCYSSTSASVAKTYKESRDISVVVENVETMLHDTVKKTMLC